MLKSLSDNLNILMAKARLNSSALAKQIGLPATTIKRIRNNEQANPTITTLLPIAEYFSISLSQLVGDEPLNAETMARTQVGFQKIPLLSWHECVHFDLLNPDKYPKKISTERKISKKGFALTIENHDLEFFPKNSLLIVEPEKIPESGNHVIVTKIEQNIASIKKYIIEIDQVYLKSLVHGLGISPLTPEHKILGVIVQYKMDLMPDVN